MNAHMTATPIAYGRATPNTRTPRDTEYDIIARVTQALIVASLNRDTDRPNFLEALHRNERLWSTLAVDIAEAANGLPQALRAKLFYLYRFTVRQSRLIRDGQGSPDVLIDINKAVLRGLRGEVPL